MTIRHTVTIFLAATMALMTAIGFTAARPDAAEAATVAVKTCAGGSIQLSEAENKMLVLHNRTRGNRGLSKLCVDPKLQKAARAHSRDMIERDYFDHDTKGTNEDFSKRLTRYGYNWRLCGENITYGSGSYGTAENRFKAWMNSPGHKANILKKGFREVGIGAFNGNYDGTDNVTMWTADFGTR